MTIFDRVQFVMNNRDCLRIRQVAKLTGLIVASEPGVDKCFLHFRGFERLSTKGILTLSYISQDSPSGMTHPAFF